MTYQPWSLWAGPGIETGKEEQDGDTDHDRAVRQIENVPPPQIDVINHVAQPHPIRQVPQGAPQNETEGQTQGKCAVGDTVVEREDPQTDEDSDGGKHEAPGREQTKCRARVPHKVDAHQSSRQIYHSTVPERADYQCLENLVCREHGQSAAQERGITSEVAFAAHRKPASAGGDELIGFIAACFGSVQRIHWEGSLPR
jgi:hypothetical protein